MRSAATAKPAATQPQKATPSPEPKDCPQAVSSNFGTIVQLARQGRFLGCEQTSGNGLRTSAFQTKSDKQLESYVRCHFPQTSASAVDGGKRFQELLSHATKAEQSFDVSRAYIFCIGMIESRLDSRSVTDRNGNEFGSRGAVLLPTDPAAAFVGLGHFDKATINHIITLIKLGVNADDSLRQIGERGSENLTEFDRRRITQDRYDENRSYLDQLRKNTLIGQKLLEQFKSYFGDADPEQTLNNSANPEVGVALIALNAQKNFLNLEERLLTVAPEQFDRVINSMSPLDRMAYQSLAHNAGGGVADRGYFDNGAEYCSTLMSLNREFQQYDQQAQRMESSDQINTRIRNLLNPPATQGRRRPQRPANYRAQVKTLQDRLRAVLRVESLRDRRAVELNYVQSVRNCMEQGNSQQTFQVNGYQCTL